MRKSMILAAAALGVGVAAAQPKKDSGYDSHANAFEQLDGPLRRPRPRTSSGGDWCKWCHYLAAFLERETAVDAALGRGRSAAN